jgi:hypothetical protein
MTDKDLILKLNKLSAIKPNQEWVTLTKNQIFNSEIKENNFSVIANKISLKEKFIVNFNVISSVFAGKKLAYAFSTLLLLVIGGLGIIKFTTPDFSTKVASLQSTTALLPVASQLQNDFVMANKKLQELTLAIKENKAGTIAPAMDEFRQSVALVAKNLNNNISTQNTQDLKEIAVNIKKLKDGRKELVLSGLAINETKESKDLDTAESILVQRLINDLDKTTLTEDQQKKMLEIKDLYEAKEYGLALEEILTINN